MLSEHNDCVFLLHLQQFLVGILGAFCKHIHTAALHNLYRVTFKQCRIALSSITYKTSVFSLKVSQPPFLLFVQ